MKGQLLALIRLGRIKAMGELNSGNQAKVLTINAILLLVMYEKPLGRCDLLHNTPPTILLMKS